MSNIPNLHKLVPKEDIYTEEGFRACVGSGFCCKKKPCGIAIKKYGHSWTSPCPSLTYAGNRYWCKEYSAVGPEVFLLEAGGVNTGCCAPLGNVRRNEMVNKLKEVNNV